MTTSTQTQLRRGTSTQVDAMTPVEGEVVIDTTNKRASVGDGTTAGGIKVPNAPDVQKQSFTYGTVGGTANAITLTNSPPVAAYANGLKLSFKATATNTASVTVAVDGLAAQNLYKLSGTSLTALTGNEIVSGAIYDISYDGTQFQITNSAGSSSGSDIQSFTSSGTWTKPSGYSADAMVLLQVWGGGGGGAGTGGAGGNGGNTTITSWIWGYGGTGGGYGPVGVGGYSFQGQSGFDGYTGGTGYTGSNGCGNAGGGGAGGTGSFAGTANSSGGVGGAGGASGVSGTAPSGGGGAAVGAGSGAAGGGGGGYAYRWARLGDMSATETITIGAAGAAGAGGAGAGAIGQAKVTVFG